MIDRMIERARKFLLDTNWTKAAVIALVALGAVAWFQACINQHIPPVPMPPTDTPTPYVNTHVPSRTLTATEEPTWTNTPFKASITPTETTKPFTPSLTPTVITMTPTLQPTDTDTPTFTSTALPTDTPTLIPPSATPTVGLITTPGRNTLPRTGASAQEIADMTATAEPTIEPTPLPPAMPDCPIKWQVEWYHWENNRWEVLMYCPNWTPTPQGVNGD